MPTDSTNLGDHDDSVERLMEIGAHVVHAERQIGDFDTADRSALHTFCQPRTPYFGLVFRERIARPIHVGRIVHDARRPCEHVPTSAVFFLLEVSLSHNSGIPGNGTEFLAYRNTRIVEKRNAYYRLPADLIRMIEDEAIAEGRERQAGRAYNPSAVVERILRAYFDAKKPRRTK